MAGRSLRVRVGNSEILDVAGGNLLRRVGVALNVALRAAPQSPLQLVGIRPGDLRQVEGEGMAQVVRPQGRAVATGILQFRAASVPDLFQDEVDGPQQVESKT